MQRMTSSGIGLKRRALFLTERCSCWTSRYVSSTLCLLPPEGKSPTPCTACPSARPRAPAPYWLHNQHTNNEALRYEPCAVPRLRRPSRGRQPSMKGTQVGSRSLASSHHRSALPIGSFASHTRMRSRKGACGWPSAPTPDPALRGGNGNTGRGPTR